MKRRRPPGLDPAFPDLPPHPTPEEEIALARRIQNGDDAAHRELVERNLRLVVRVAKRYRELGSSLSLGDLFQEGAIGLVVAARRFDPDRGIKFCTYAPHWINQTIRRACQGSGIVQIPVYLQEQASRVRRGMESADDLTPSQRDHITAGERARSVWLDSQIWTKDTGYGSYLEEVVSAEPDERPEDTADYVHSLLKALDPKSRRIIVAYYGLDGQPPRATRAIGQAEKTSRYHTGRLVHQAHARMREYAEGRAS